MISKEHKKHPALVRPEGGSYHRNEWALIGAPCDIIQQVAKDINESLKAVLKLGFLDAKHRRAKAEDRFHTKVTDHIDYESYRIEGHPPEKHHRKFYNHLDLLLINGNHFKGAKQIVLINEDKKESLSKKIDRLTDVRMILLKHSNDEIYDFVIENIKDQDKVKVFRISEINKISQALFEDMQLSMPSLYGLILSGGRSQRMGADKGAIDYHGKAQREFEADMLNSLCNQTFISCRKNQDELIESRYKKIYDTFDDLGPFGGILSAFRANPNVAWFSLACDLPYLDKSTIQHLIKHRNPTKLASCFYNPETKFPEPLITIWEPRAYPVLLEFLSQGYACPRKVLINSDIEMIEMPNVTQMTNVNEPEERDAVFSSLK